MGWTLKPIKYHRDSKVSGGAASEYLTSKLVGPLRLRIINIVDYTTQCKVSVAIRNKSSPEGSGETISLINRQWQVEAGIDVGWEGDIVIDANSVIEANFEDGNLANDNLFLTVGYEQI